MYGTAIGDYIGSRFEGAGFKSRSFDLFHQDCRFTDDTICAVAATESLLDGSDPAEVMRRWCRQYPDARYGRWFRNWVTNTRMGRYNSWGNGAAMRASPAGFLATSAEEAEELADLVTAITHGHPEGLRGARATAWSIWAARAGWGPDDIREGITERYAYDMSRTVDEIAPDYRFDLSCAGTVPPALTCALEADDFEGAIRNAISLGGDADTLAAIAGGLAEALFGIPSQILDAVLLKLPADLRGVLDRMYG